MIEIDILGTAAGAPTKERGHPAISVKHEGSIYLFDCGENAQRQMKIAGISLLKIKAIFITHWHADHFAGLIGLMQTMALLERKQPLYIFSPKPGKAIVMTLQRLNNRIHFVGPVDMDYKLIVKEISKGKVFADDRINVEAMPAIHSIPSVAYKFSENDRPGRFNVEKATALGLKPHQFGELQKGRNAKANGKTIKPSDVMGEPRPGLKIVYTGDTAYCKKLIKFAEFADLLIHEATYTIEFEEQARKVGHSTAWQAAEIAKKANVKKLVLVHFSSRHKDAEAIYAEAKDVFENTELGHDFMKIVLK